LDGRLGQHLRDMGVRDINASRPFSFSRGDILKNLPRLYGVR
jgi:hypothetical protein